MNKLIGWLIVVVLAGCSGQKKTINARQIQNGEWALDTLQGKPVLFQDKEITISFGENNLLSGFAGCNHLSGTYQLKPNGQLDLSKVGVTRKLCPEPEMKQEDEFLSMLSAVKYAAIQNQELMLKDEKEHILSTFKKKEPQPEIVNKYWKLVQLKAEKVEMKENQEREQYFKINSDGSFTGFAGCNQFNGTCKVESDTLIKFESNIAVTMKICPNAEVNEHEFLEVFSLVKNYKITGDTLFLNSEIHAPLAVFEAVYF